ncbi:hypothetical protein AVEN_217426-1, partial [Araneus ventricosus]
MSTVISILQNSIGACRSLPNGRPNWPSGKVSTPVTEGLARNPIPPEDSPQ